MKEKLKKKKRSVNKKLLDWYKINQRILPWRQNHDPYKILVSEIMLQQTQVNRVLIKYREFLTNFPNLESLALASFGDVIKTWKGLGYNRRALFLQKTAQAIVTNHKGKFPQDIKTLISLPGIGDYTARAVLSFAFKQPVPMMDTNHRRFYQRIFFGLEIKKDKELLVLAEQILPKKHAYDFNQALMDFGSLVCKTQKPTCEVCPLKKNCLAYPKILDENYISSQKAQKNKAKKIIPFKKTDRFIRGKIIDELRDRDEILIKDIINLFKNFDKERIDKVILGLQKDSLIVIKNESILLPD